MFFSFLGFSCLSENLGNLFENGQFSDFTINVKDREFKIHKAILAARSPVFASMLQHDFKEKQDNTVDLSDYDPDVFEDFLGYLYSGNSERISTENVAELYEAAEKYDIPTLKEECRCFMKGNISDDSFCDIISLAITYEDKDLLDHATKYFIENTEKILLTVQWQKFLKENTVPGNELYIKSFRNLSEKLNNQKLY